MPHTAREWPWVLAGALGILPLLWASRTPTLGVPVIEDYTFLHSLAWHRPVDIFGPLGFAWYWRPVSRQLYYFLVGPFLVRAHWVAVLLALAMLLAIYALLYRLARRAFAPPMAAAIACFPLLAEPARVLIAWPSGGQHLIAACLAALAIERAAAGRLASSCVAAFGAVLSHEAAVIVLPALPLIAGFSRRSWRAAARWACASVLVAALWGAGYIIARHHGSGLPESAGIGLHPRALWAVLVRALLSQFGWEGIVAGLRVPLAIGAGLLVAAGLALSFAPSARRRIARAGPVLLGGLGWFLAGIVPLALLVPDGSAWQTQITPLGVLPAWEAWRATVASLGLAFVLTGWLAQAWRPLAAALVALRLATLLLAAPAPRVVASEPPGADYLTFANLVRMQRTVESTRRALLESAPRLPRHAVVCYWNVPRLTAWAFADSRALQVWYHDTTLVWSGFGGREGWRSSPAALIEYEREWPWPAVAIDPEAQRLYRRAGEASEAGELSTAESLLIAALSAQPRRAPGFAGNIRQNLAWISFARREYARADSLNRLALEECGETPDYWLLSAELAVARGDVAGARRAALRSLELDDRDPRTIQLLMSLGPAPSGSAGP
ncbi:MAG TPA: hypothetical protein VMS88_04845 [Terriglobales bacterium]|nr:hypothetical protein [Terriglobales bacterium]